MRTQLFVNNFFMPFCKISKVQKGALRMVRLLTLFPGAELLSVEAPQPPAAGADAMDAPADADQPSEDTIRKERRS